jgi:glycerol-3-phosphate dehydrogenase (NAD(P)+)
MANVAAENGRKVVLYSNEEASLEEINSRHSNSKYVTGRLDATISATDNLAIALRDAEVVFLILPSKVLARVLAETKKLGQGSFREKFVIFTKGLDEETGEFFSNLVSRIFPAAEVAVFSGPNFAEEIFEKKLTLTTLATEKAEFFSELEPILGCDFLSLTYFDDPIAVQLCGLVKNAVALVCGIIEGLEMGRNAFAAMVMKGIGEMTSLCRAFHRNEGVVLTPAGIGDLVLTCTSHKSRNTSFGYRVGLGENPGEIIGNGSTTVEGISNARSLYNMAKKFGMEGTVAELLLRIVDGSLSREELVSAVAQSLRLGQQIRKLD